MLVNKSDCIEAPLFLLCALRWEKIHDDILDQNFDGTEDTTKQVFNILCQLEDNKQNTFSLLLPNLTQRKWKSTISLL